MKRSNLYSVSGRLLRNDLITVWTSFYPVDDAGLSGVLERDVGMRGQSIFKLEIPVYTDIGRTFGVRVVKYWNFL